MVNTSLGLEKKLLAIIGKDRLEKYKSTYCDECDGMAEPALFDFTRKRLGKEYHFEKIYGLVCQKCGNKYLDALSVIEMEREIKKKLKDAK